jgi:hypothetical protein
MQGAGAAHGVACEGAGRVRPQATATQENLRVLRVPMAESASASCTAAMREASVSGSEVPIATMEMPARGFKHNFEERQIKEKRTSTHRYHALCGSTAGLAKQRRSVLFNEQTSTRRITRRITPFARRALRGRAYSVSINEREDTRSNHPVHSTPHDASLTVHTFPEPFPFPSNNTICVHNTVTCHDVLEPHDAAKHGARVIDKVDQAHDGG